MLNDFCHYSGNQYNESFIPPYGDGEDYGTGDGDGCSPSAQFGWGDSAGWSDGDGPGHGFAGEFVFVACTDTTDLQAVMINTLVRAC